jgi:hypothetical protein
MENLRREMGLICLYHKNSGLSVGKVCIRLWGMSDNQNIHKAFDTSKKTYYSMAF